MREEHVSRVVVSATREGHQVLSEGCMDGVRDSLLQMNEFKEWNTSEEGALLPVLFHYESKGREY